MLYDNYEKKDLVVKVNLKEDANIIQQKGRPISNHLQDQLADELKRLIKNGSLERATEITEDCCVSPAVPTVKKDKSVKIALDSQKLNKTTIKKTPITNMEVLTSRILRKISEKKQGEIWITKLDFDNAYGQVMLDEKSRGLCIFTVTGVKFTGYYRFLKVFYALADIPTNFQERIDKTLEFKHPALLDDIIVVTKGYIEEHKTEIKNNQEIRRSRLKTKPKK